MANFFIDIPPGIFTDSTAYSLGARWTDCDHIRFWENWPQKIGGWQKFSSSPSAIIPGRTRSIVEWTELAGGRNLAFGSNYGVYLYRQGAITDITPYRDTESLTDPFSTATGSATVTITDVNHGALVGDRITLSTTISVGGLSLSGTYSVASVIDDDNYTITASSNATSTVSGGGGSVDISYTTNTTSPDAVLGFGWGTGLWSTSTWGTPRSTSVVTLDIGFWFMDSWGEDLIINQREGASYYWDATNPTTRAALITNAPSVITQAMVSTPDRHMVAFGAVPLGGSATDFDPMLVRWSDQEDYTTWTPTASNTAGDQRLAQGNRIIAARKSRGQHLIWTDTAMYSMQFLGPPFTFGFTPLGVNCGPIGPNSMAVHEDVALWMGRDNFYIYDGAIKILDCTVQNYVFENINLTQIEKVFCVFNREWNEVWWFYPSANSTENNRYAKYNYRLNCWDIGTMERTAFLDSALYSNPIGVNPSGDIFYHEIGTNANTAPLAAHIEWGALELGQGDTLTFVDRLIPDTRLADNTSLQVTLYTKRYPNSPTITKGPYTTTNATEKISMRARFRQCGGRFESSDLNNNWRLGRWRMNGQPDGRR